VMNCPGRAAIAISGASIHMWCTPGMTSTLEDMVARVCFMLKPKQYQSSKMKKQNDRAKIKNETFFHFEL
jgi:hypothetical protein